MKNIKDITIQEKIEMYEYCLYKAKNCTSNFFICINATNWLKIKGYISGSHNISMYEEFFHELYVYCIKDSVYWFKTNEDRIQALKDILAYLNLTLKSDNKYKEFKKIEIEMEKCLTLSLEEAKKIYETVPSMKEQVLKLYPELECKIVKRWEDLQTINGYFISVFSNIVKLDSFPATDGHRNTFATKEQAESALAYAQLTQLMQATGKAATKEDWKNNICKYCIDCEEDNLIRPNRYGIEGFIAFTCEKTRDKFLKLHQDLLKQYFQIK